MTDELGFITHNAKVKYYPLSQNSKTILFDKPISAYDMYYEQKKKYDPELIQYLIDNGFIDDSKVYTRKLNENGSREDNIKASVERVFDMAMLNKFEYFVTLTYNPDKVDSLDKKVVMKSLKKYLQNMVQRKNMKYVLIPELHKSGRIHLHGFITGNFKYSLAFDPHTGLQIYTDRGQEVYNIDDWGFGWSTAVKLDDSIVASACYITKYITKEQMRIFGNYYYAGGGIVRKPDIFLLNVDFEQNEFKDTKAHHVAPAFVNIKYFDSYGDFDEDYPANLYDISIGGIE